MLQPMPAQTADSTPLYSTHEVLADKPVDYHILQSSGELQSVMHDPRYWRVVEYGDNAVQMLRVPLQIRNEALLEIQQQLCVRVADRQELSAAFRTTQDHQYKYPWGDEVSAARAPYLMHSNPNGMGMNMAGLYFNGPDNPDNPLKNGLWMVTAERDTSGHYIQGDRSGTAGNVGVFEVPAAGQRGILPEERGILPGTRGILPEERGKLAHASHDNVLTPAGIGEATELYPNEAYLIIKEMDAAEKSIYAKAKQILNHKVSADHGIALVGIGQTATAEKIIAFGVAGHCMMCPNPYSLTMPINGPAIAAATGIPVIEYPEFRQHRVMGRMPIIPHHAATSCETSGGNRLYLPS